MAEVALIASIIQIVNLSLRLNSRLFVFGETIATANKSIITISKDVELISYVLQYLGRIFEDNRNPIYSNKATKTAEAMAQEHSNVFQEMGLHLLKRVPNLKSENIDKKPRARTLLERLK